MMQGARRKKQVYHPVQRNAGRNPGEDAVHEQRRQQNAVKHKRRRRGNNILLYLMVLILMAAVGIILIFTVFFKVAVITVEGLSKYSEEDIIKTSGIQLEQNMFRLDTAAIESALVEKYSYLEKVKVQLKPSDTIIIQVTEAQPVAALEQSGSYLLISEKGRVLETGVALPEGILEVKGLKPMEISAGETLNGMLQKQTELAAEAGKVKEEDTQEERESKKNLLALRQALLAEMQAQFDMMRAFIEVVGNGELGGIRDIDLSDKYNIMASYEDRITIEFGTEADLALKMQYVREVLSQLEPDFEGKIDITNPDWGAGVRQIDLAAQHMTPDEYAEYLFQKNSASQSSSSEQSGSGAESSGTESGAASGNESSAASSEASSQASKPESEPATN